MKFQQIRNATAIIDYAGKRFLVDPMLAEKGTFPGFPGTVNSETANPVVALPIPVGDLRQVDVVLITHTHADHWDDAAKDILPKGLPVFVQNEQDREEVARAGFTDVRLLSAQGTEYETIRLVKTSGQHGSDAIMEKLGDILGEVSGVIFSHPSEKTVYLAGDTVWNHHVADVLKRHTPKIVILNCGDARVAGMGSIIMGKQDVFSVHQAAPEATIIATHMEAVNHAVLSRKELREFLKEKDMAESVLVPEDGETITLSV